MRALLPFLLLATSAAHATPLQFRHSGRLTDTTGSAVSGPHKLSVRVYHNEGDAVGSAAFIEHFNAVPFEQGYFAVTLGAAVGTPFDDAVLADGGAWLGVALDDGAELAPRSRLVAVPYAARAHIADGVVLTVTPTCAGGVGEGALRWNTTADRLEVCNGTAWAGVSAGLTGTPRNCAEIKAANAGAASGTYTIDPDAAGPVPSLSVECDMRPDGGWTRIDVPFLATATVLTNTAGSTGLANGNSEIRFFPASRDAESWHDYHVGFNFTRIRGQYTMVPHSHPDDDASSECTADTGYATRHTCASCNRSWQRMGVPGLVVKTCGSLGGQYESNRTVVIAETPVPSGGVLRFSGGDETGDPGNELYGIRDVALFVK